MCSPRSCMLQITATYCAYPPLLSADRRVGMGTSPGARLDESISASVGVLVRSADLEGRHALRISESLSSSFNVVVTSDESEFRTLRRRVDCGIALLTRSSPTDFVASLRGTTPLVAIVPPPLEAWKILLPRMTRLVADTMISVDLLRTVTHAVVWGWMNRLGDAMLANPQLARRTKLRRASHMMLAPDTPPVQSVAGVARATGCTARALEYAWHDSLGSAPMTLYEVLLRCWLLRAILEYTRDPGSNWTAVAAALRVSPRTLRRRFRALGAGPPSGLNADDLPSVAKSVVAPIADLVE